jgi:hypothetical protein
MGSSIGQAAYSLYAGVVYSRSFLSEPLCGNERGPRLPLRIPRRLLGITAIAADGRKALPNLALFLEPPDRRGGGQLRKFALPLVFGYLLVDLLLLCIAFGLAIVANVRDWGSFSIGSDLLTILESKRTPEGPETVIGTGAFAMSPLAGVLNAIAGTILWSLMSNGR